MRFISILALLAGLTGCATLHREASGDTTARGLMTADGAGRIIDRELAGIAIAKASQGTPVTVTLTSEGDATFQVGHGYGSGGYASTGDWYSRAAQAQRYYESQRGGIPASSRGTAPQSTMDSNPVSARDVTLDVNVPCPKDREPENVAEQLGCHTAELDAHDKAIEAGRAVRQ